MDRQSGHHPEAESSSSASTALSHPPTHPEPSESKSLRTSARVKASKQKFQAEGKGKEFDIAGIEEFVSGETSHSRNTRSAAPTIKNRRSKDTTSVKGKGKEIVDETLPRSHKRSRRTATTNTPLAINEPVKDQKGKKRAIPEFTPENDGAGPSTKRPRTSYSLRSSTISSQTHDMPRKTSTKTTKGKVVSKSKPASSSRLQDEDVEMIGAGITKSGSADVEQHREEHTGSNNQKGECDLPHDDRGSVDDGCFDDDEDDVHDAGDSSGDGGANPPIPGGSLNDFDVAMAFLGGGDIRQFGSYMASLTTRLKNMLGNIKTTADPTTRLLTLQELSELLSISTEDTLAGSFPVEQYVRELVRILGGKVANDDDDDDDDDEDQGTDEDAQFAAALAASRGGPYQGDENLEAQVLACRCLANLMEALPGVAHTVVYHGAIPVLCSKLVEISYIDLAEQTLSTVEKISEEFPSSIIREGGLAALLNYLDFFSIAVQRTALQAAANCCRNVSVEHFNMVKGVWPIIRGCLSYSDQRLVEFACLCVIRVIDSYYRSSIENLQLLVDRDLIKAVNQLLLPAGGSPLIASNTFTLLLRALATCARASSKITISLLEADIVDTLYQILTGVLPSANGHCEGEQGDAIGGQGLGGGLADMAVMENLAHRPKDQVEETLSLISELLPPLPKDGVFDHKAYTEKSLARLVKAKAKADRTAVRQSAQTSPSTSVLAPSASSDVSAAATVEGDAPTPSPPELEDMLPGSAVTSTPVKEAPPERIELLRSKPVVVERFVQLLMPILIDVYAASVVTPIRIKTLTGLLKAVSFLDADAIKQVFMSVPIATFASSILSSKDHPSLVISALQLVDLLMSKVSQLYRPAFRREGVFFEIEAIGERALLSSKAKEKEKEKEKNGEKDSSEASEPGIGNASITAIAAPATIPGYKKLNSLALDPEDAITLRCRVIQFKYLTGEDEAFEDASFDHLRGLLDRLSSKNATEQEFSEALWELSDLFSSARTSISSFELLQGGVAGALLRYATEETYTVSVTRRRELFFDAFTSGKAKNMNGGQTSFAVLVKKLQESLTRIESFDVTTVSQSSDDSKRSSPSLLARQLRLRLVAVEGSDTPRNLQNIVVSIHAIATFQALHDYLRPRVSGLIGGSSRLSGMLAALAASGFGSPRSEEPIQKIATSSTANKGSTSGEQNVGRRRSQRLAKLAGNAEPLEAKEMKDEDTVMGEPTAAASTSEAIRSDPMSSDIPVEPELADDYTNDDEIDAEVFDDEDSDNSIAEKTITVNVAEDGSRIEAQTPDGTRVATPGTVTRDGQATPTRSSRGARASYAAALKTKPTDWHLEFSMNDYILPLDLTIYGAIHQHEMRKKTTPLSSSMLWQGVYTIKYKKVPGPQLSPDARTDDGSRTRSVAPNLSSLPDDAPYTKILRLLRLLYHLNNTLEAERLVFTGEKRFLPDASFVNNKLTAKLTRQLEEPMIVASSCLPDWALDLPQHFPFLFPFTTRYNFLQSTSFGYARLIIKWQTQQNRGQDTSRRDDGIGFLGRLQRQKVRISRKHILESAVKVFELYGSSSSILEVEYFEEVGTGLGPTLEFYSLVSKEFARKDLKIWRDADVVGAGVYVSHPFGLYPAPVQPDEPTKGGHKGTHILRIIGQFIAKAMLDSRTIDLSLNKVFLKLVLDEEVPLTIASLRLVDTELTNSLEKLKTMAAAEQSRAHKDKLSSKIAKMESANIEDLSLDFTLPGYDIELCPGGKNIVVTANNVDEYIKEIINAILGDGVREQVKAFKEGFSKVFPVIDLKTFTADELVMLFGNSEEDWSTETLSEALKADHGFNVESRAIRDLIEIMADYGSSTRRAYLQFITGSPKLPIGGFRGLNPPFTVVRKPHEAPLKADDYLPSVMTCVNYLKLPDYSSKTVMREKLRIAMEEGVGSFHLS